MDNRFRNRDNARDFGERGNWRSRQDEQYSSDRDDQYGEASWRNQSGSGEDRWQSGGSYGGDYDRGAGYQRNERDRSSTSGGYRGDTSSLDEYDQQSSARWDRGGRSSGSYGSASYGGGDYGRSYGGSRSQGGYGPSRYGADSYGSNQQGRDTGRIPPRRYDPDDRGFFDRASDEVMSWFGDDDAARRREMDSREDHRGKGPAGYSRSKERLLEDANERLMHDSSLDASNITVTCDDNEITLEGTVDSRSAKRRAEDIVDNISGVKHVQNNLRVKSNTASYYSETSTLTEN